MATQCTAVALQTNGPFPAAGARVLFWELLVFTSVAIAGVVVVIP
jgi:hypothetical protein